MGIATRRGVTIAAAPSRIPDSHRDLLLRPICGVLTTMDHDAHPHSVLVWLDAEGETIRINTTLERRTSQNLTRNPRASVLLVDPDDTSRYLQVRGDAVLVSAGADHLDARVICRIRPVRVSVDAIHR